MKKLLILPPILVGAALLYYIVSAKQPLEQIEVSEQTQYVRTVKVEPTDFVPKIIGFGVVKPARVWNAVAEVSGQIDYIHPDFKRGAILQKGSEIARISTQDYDFAIEQAEANRRAGEAKLKELIITEQNNRSALTIEDRALDIKNQEFNRAQILVDRGTASQSTLDEASSSLLVQEQRVQELRNSLKLLPAQITAQKEQISVYKTQLAAAKLDRERTSIRLPFDARISEVNVEVTQYVGVGTTLGKADGIKTAEIEAQIPMAQMGQLSNFFPINRQQVEISANFLRKMTEIIGLRAIVRLRTGFRDVEWQAEVVRISDTVDPTTRTVGIIVAVEDHYLKVVPGQRPPLVKEMFVEVELRANSVPDRIVVPRAALHEGQVYTVGADNRLQIKPVKVDVVQGNLAVIAEGLFPGDQIVVSDISPAIDGMLLKTAADEKLTKELLAEASGKGPVR